MVEYSRSQRVAEQIHKEISALLVKGLKDPRIGFVTITAVEVSSDLRQAKVYFTVMGEGASRSDNLTGLENSVPFIRRHLGKHLRLRYVPEIKFLYDTSIEYGEHIETLLRETKRTQGDDCGDSQAD